MLYRSVDSGSRARRLCFGVVREVRKIFDSPVNAIFCLRMDAVNALGLSTMIRLVQSYDQTEKDEYGKGQVCSILQL